METSTDSAAPAHPLSFLMRVRDGLRALPAAAGARPAALLSEYRTPLVRHIDAERARTLADRTPTEEFPVVISNVTCRGVSWR